MKKLFMLFSVLMLVIVFFTACEEKINKESDYLKDEIKQAKASGDTARVEKLEEELKNVGKWFLYRTDTKTTEDIDKSDESQKVVYSFVCRDNVHTITLNYEPLSTNSKIPAYKQKCVCTLGEMPFELKRGQSYRVDVTCEYTESNEYAGISNGCWLESNNEKIKIVNNDGYTREDVYAGDRKTGRHDTLKTSFTITLPDFQEGAYNFDINFVSDCGVTSYNYVWTD